MMRRVGVNYLAGIRSVCQKLKLYRAVDKVGATIDFSRTAKRDRQATQL